MRAVDMFGNVNLAEKASVKATYKDACQVNRTKGCVVTNAPDAIRINGVLPGSRCKNLRSRGAYDPPVIQKSAYKRHNGPKTVRLGNTRKIREVAIIGLKFDFRNNATGIIRVTPNSLGNHPRKDSDVPTEVTKSRPKGGHYMAGPSIKESGEREDR